MFLQTYLTLFLLPLALGAEVVSEDISKNTCPRKSQRGDKVSVHYRGTLLDGTKFDASYDRGTPLGFVVGNGQVIKGWDEGLLDMCIGDTRKLTIPPEFGYGQRAMGPIPAGSTLVFETELMGIDGVKAEDSTPVEASSAEASSTDSTSSETTASATAEEATPTPVEAGSSTAEPVTADPVPTPGKDEL